jgi:uncharacterized repeat protein (TIGR02543 family)/LPXTG-motif cell wall-anchored protein
MKKIIKRKEIVVALLIVIMIFAVSSSVFASDSKQPVQIPGAGGTTDSGVSYTVSFNTNGGIPVLSQTVKSGEKAVRPTDPTRDGFTFDDWYADSVFTTKFNFDEPITAQTTIFAKWTSSASATPAPTPTPEPAPTKAANNIDDSSLPQTGDASDYAIFALIAVCAVVSIVAFIKTKKYNLK